MAPVTKTCKLKIILHQCFYILYLYLSLFDLYLIYPYLPSKADKIKIISEQLHDTFKHVLKFPNKNFLYNHNVRNKEFTNFSKRKKKGIISFDSSIQEVRQNSESNDDPFC